MRMLMKKGNTGVRRGRGGSGGEEGGGWTGRLGGGHRSENRGACVRIKTAQSFSRGRVALGKQKDEKTRELKDRRNVWVRLWGGKIGPPERVKKPEAELGKGDSLKETRWVLTGQLIGPSQGAYVVGRPGRQHAEAEKSSPDKKTPAVKPESGASL